MKTNLPVYRRFDGWTGRRSDRYGALFAAAITILFIAACMATNDSTRIARAADQLFRIVTVAEGLERPWGITFLADGDLLVTERPGALRRVSKDGALSEPIAGLPAIAAIGQGGLLDVQTHPQFAENGLIYFSYAAKTEKLYSTHVARAKLLDGELGDVTVIFRAEPGFAGGRHFGSRLIFDNDGYLYVSVGDRGYRPNGQDRTTHAGSILRLHDDGSVPADNPFVDEEGVRAEIWSYGHRNPQGLTIDRDSGRIWANEHGPRGGDELNEIIRGANFGWAEVSYGEEYGTDRPVGEATERADTQQPHWFWVPSIAPSGLAWISNDVYPDWQHSLLNGALKFQLVSRLPLGADGIEGEERFLEGTLGRIRDVKVGPDGLVYLLTDENDGGVYRLEPL